MKSSESLEIPTFGVDLKITAAQQSIDTYSRFTAYWKSCVIRNTQPIDVMLYRTSPSDDFKTVQPNAELPLKGWGSYLEITTAAAAPQGIVEFDVARQVDAFIA